MLFRDKLAEEFKKLSELRKKDLINKLPYCWQLRFAHTHNPFCRPLATIPGYTRAYPYLTFQEILTIANHYTPPEFLPEELLSKTIRLELVREKSLPGINTWDNRLLPASEAKDLAPDRIKNQDINPECCWKEDSVIPDSVPTRIDTANMNKDKPTLEKERKLGRKLM